MTKLNTESGLTFYSKDGNDLLKYFALIFSNNLFTLPSPFGLIKPT